MCLDLRYDLDMRIRDLHDALDARVGLLVPGQTVSGQVVRLVGIGAALRALRELQTYPIGTATRSLIAQALASKAQNWVDGGNVHIEELNASLGFFQQAQLRLVDLRDSLAAILESAPTPHVAIKLPRTDTVQSLAERARDIQQILAIPLHDYFKVGVELQGVDRGSIWLELAVGAVAAGSSVVVALRAQPGAVKEFIEAIFKGAKDLIEVRARHAKTYAELERYRSETEALEVVNKEHAKARAKILRELGESAAKAAEDVGADKAADAADSAPFDEERLVRLLNAIEKAADLLGEGADVRLNLPASIETKARAAAEPSQAVQISGTPQEPKKLPDGS